MQSMATLNNVALANAHANLRSHRRFVIRDKRLWQLKIQSKKFPLDWVHDVSRNGIQVRQGKYQGLRLGESVNIQLRFLGSTILEVQGRVKWLRSDHDHMNMNVLGIEFASSQGRPIKKWVNKRMIRSQALQLQEEVHRLELAEAEQEHKRVRFQLAEWQWACVVLLPFVAGYMTGFFQ